MVCEAVPGAKGAQRRRKVFSTLSYLTFSDRLSAAQYITLLLVTGTAHKPRSVLVRPDQFPVKNTAVLYLTHIHTRLLSVVSRLVRLWYLVYGWFQRLWSAIPLRFAYRVCVEWGAKACLGMINTGLFHKACMWLSGASAELQQPAWVDRICTVIYFNVMLHLLI